MQKIIYNIFPFLFANALGFMSTSIIYTGSLLGGRLPIEAIEADPAAFQSAFFSGTIITWIFCGLFSFGFFIVRSKWRFAFLLIPAILPAIYGLSVLNAFASSAS